MMDPLTATPGDFLVCGACHMNFKLSSMQDFIQHKLFDCQGIPQKAMECQSCPNKFRTPWSLLQHAQNTHSLKIFLQQGPYSPGIAGVHIDKRSTENSDEMSLQNSSGHIDAIQEPTKAPADIQVSDRSAGKPVVAVHTPLALQPPHTVAVVRSVSSSKPVSGPKTSCKCAMLAPSAVPATSNAVATSVAKCSLQCGCIFTRSALGAPPPVTAPPVMSAPPATAPPVTAPPATAPPVTAPPATAPSVTSPPVIAPPVIAPPATAPPGTAPPATAPSVQAASNVVVKESVPPTTAGTNLLLHNLPNLVQGAFKAQSILTGPGKHPISVLQPIKLPHGAIIGTAVAIGKPALTRMPFTTLPPVGVSTQVKTAFTVPKEINTVQEAICVNRDKSPNSQGLITAVVASPLMITPVISKLTESQVVSAKDDTKGLDKSPNQLKAVPHTLTLHPPATASNSSLVLQNSHISGFISSPKSIQTNSTSEVNSSNCSISTEIREQEDLSPKQPQTCECLCCKAGKCCVWGEPVISKIDNVIPSGLNVAQNFERSEVQQIRIHCCDASVQVDHNKCPDKTEGDDADKNSDDAVRCCDNQDCGVTIMPGTHEGLKKCCNAVVPKKRKRHMETKHRVKKRVTAPSFSMPQENTIYIDFQPGSDIPRFSSATGVTLSAADTLGTITVNTTSANSQQMLQSIDNQRSLTLSFPVSYTRKASCSPGNCSRMGQGQECTCGCCPLKSSRDKKSKSARRLSSSSNDSKKELTTGRTTAGSAATGQTNNDLAIGVKDESMMSLVDSSEEASQSSISGTRKILRPLGRVGKKRRYPTSRPFKCDKCDHAFNQRIHLKKHQSKHTGVKPFKCEQCDYSTVERSHLKVHIRVHTGEKPYKCSHCEYATAQNSTLKIHLKRHHGQGGEDGSGGSLSCDVCGREFDDEGPFLQHQQEHPPQASSSVSSSGGVSSSEQLGMTEPESAVQAHSGDEEALPDGRLIIKEM